MSASIRRTCLLVLGNLLSTALAMQLPRTPGAADLAIEASTGLHAHSRVHLQFDAEGELERAHNTSTAPFSEAPRASSKAWPCKNGDLWRTGQSQSPGPRSLTAPSWTFEGYHQNGDTSYASPIVDEGGNSYIITTHGLVFALGADGQVLWSFNSEAAALSNPMLVGGALIFGSALGKAFALDAASGDVRWKAPYAAGSGTDSWSVAVGQGIALFGGYPEVGGSDNTHLFALNATTGASLWSFDTGTHTMNVLPAVVGDSVVFSDFRGGVYRLKLATGEVLWRTPENGNASLTTGGVVVGPNGLVYVTSNAPLEGSYGAPFGGKGILRAHDLQTGAVRWERTFGMEANNAPALMDRGSGSLAVIVGLGNNAMMPLPVPPLGDHWPGTVQAFDGADGKDLWTFGPVDWPEQAAAGSTLEYLCLPDACSNAVVSKDGIVYIGWQGGKVFAINGTSGRQVSEYELGSGIQGEPGIANGALYVVSCNKMVAFKP